MSLFDTDNFLGESAGAELSTERVLIPIGTYSDASIKDLKLRTGVVAEGERAGNKWAMLSVQWEINDQALRDTLDRAVVTINQMIMLDITEDGNLDTGKGKNVRLGKLKKSLGLNSEEVSWGAFLGRRAVIQVGHGVNKKDNSPTEEVLATAGH